MRSEEAQVWRQLTEMIVLHRIAPERYVALLGQLYVGLARVRNETVQKTMEMRVDLSEEESDIKIMW